jgi:hypothetical protein
LGQLDSGMDDFLGSSHHSLAYWAVNGLDVGARGEQDRRQFSSSCPDCVIDTGSLAPLRKGIRDPQHFKFSLSFRIAWDLSGHLDRRHYCICMALKQTVHGWVTNILGATTEVMGWIACCILANYTFRT